MVPLSRVLVVIALALACGCGAPSAALATPVATGATQPSPAPLATATPGPSAPASRPSPTAAPTTIPALCPRSAPTASTRTADGIGIVGDQGFISHSVAALDLLKARAPAHFTEIATQIVTLLQVDAFSGMCIDTGTYRVGTETAHAPGYSIDRQVIWYAGTIAHDAHHRALQRAGLPYMGRDGELACLVLQRDVLARIDPDPFFRSYVQGLIDGVDDPKNQYWTDPNRHW